jgi:hypothetical protein
MQRSGRAPNRAGQDRLHETSPEYCKLALYVSIITNTPHPLLNINQDALPYFRNYSERL